MKIMEKNTNFLLTNWTG